MSLCVLCGLDYRDVGSLCIVCACCAEAAAESEPLD